MKPWESEQTIRDVRRMGGERRIHLGFELTAAALAILIAGIRAHDPRLKGTALRKEIDRSLWDIPQEIWKKSSRR